MGSKIISAAGKIKSVKNLGWLLRNWQDVESFTFFWNPQNPRMVDGELAANLKSGGQYQTDFASLSVCFRWLDRPVFQGISLTIRNIKMKTWKNFCIGDEKYKTIKNLDNTKDYLKHQEEQFLK